MKQMLDLRQTNLQVAIGYVSGLNWSYFYYSQSIDEKIEILYNSLKNAVRLIPRTNVKMKENDTPWMNTTIKLLINKRQKAYKGSNIHLYNHYKQRVKDAITLSKKVWADSLTLKNKNPWKTLHMKKNNDSVINNLCRSLGDDTEAATKINEQLCSIFTSVFSFPNISFKLENDYVTVQEAEEFLSNIDLKKSFVDEEFLEFYSKCLPIFCQLRWLILHQFVCRLEFFL